MTQEQIAERLFMASNGLGWPLQWGWAEMPAKQKLRWLRLADEVLLILREEGSQAA